MAGDREAFVGAATSSCPSVDQLAAFLDGGGTDRNSLAAHIEGCSLCRDILGIAAGEGGEATGDAATPAVQLRETPGRYELRRLIGRGGQALVWAAYDRALAREIAFKELRDGAPGSDGYTVADRARFLRSAQITAQLAHPSILSVYDLGLRSSGTPFYTMPLVEGDTLAQALEERTSLAARLELLPHVVDVCNALAFAHSRGIVHRDVNPANVMVGRFRETVIIDWGLAGAAGRPLLARFGATEELSLTVEGRVAGTPAYISPEQARGAATDARTDVWGVGGLLFALITRRSLYAASDSQQLMQRARDGARPDIAGLQRGVPPELVAIIDRALRPQADQRYTTATELAEDLRAYLGGREVSVYRYSRLRKMARFVARHRLLVAVSGVAFASVVAGLVVSVRALAAEETASDGWERAATQARRAQLRAAEQRDAAALNLARAYDASASQLRADGMVLESAMHAVMAVDSLEGLGDVPERGDFVARAASAMQAVERRPLSRVAWRRKNPSDPNLPEIPAGVSPRDGQLALPGPAGQIRLLDSADGRERARITLASGALADLAWLPDGRLAAATAEAVELFTDTGARVDSFRHSAGEQVELVVVGDLLFAVAVDGRLSSLDLRDDAPTWVAEGALGDTVIHARRVPGRRQLAVSTAASSIVLWDLDARRRVATIELLKPVDSFELSPDGTLALAGGAGWVNFVDLAEGSVDRIPSPYRSGVRAVGWIDPRTVITLDGAGRVAVISEQTGWTTLRAQHGQPSKRASIVVGDNKVHVVDGSSATQWRYTPDWKGPSSYSVTAHMASKRMRSIVATADGSRVLVASPDGLWVLGPSPARSQLFATDGQLVSGYDGTLAGRIVAATPREVWVWESDGRLVRRHQLPGRGWTIDIAADERSYAALSVPNTVFVWDLETGELRRRLTVEGSVNALALSADGSRLALMRVGAPIEIVEVGTGRSSLQLEPGGAWPLALFLAGDRQLVAAGEAGIAIWDLDGPGPVTWLHEEGDRYLRLRASADGSLILADGVSQAALINRANGRVFPLSGASGYYLLRDGTMLVLDETLRMRQRTTDFAVEPFDHAASRRRLEADLRASASGFEIVREFADP